MRPILGPEIGNDSGVHSRCSPSSTGEMPTHERANHWPGPLAPVSSSLCGNFMLSLISVPRADICATQHPSWPVIGREIAAPRHCPAEDRCYQHGLRVAHSSTSLRCILKAIVLANPSASLTVTWSPQLGDTVRIPPRQATASVDSGSSGQLGMPPAS